MNLFRNYFRFVSSRLPWVLPATTTIVIILGYFTETASSAKSNLVLSQILFRHGFRAPESPYPSDPFQNVTKYWPNGWGQLTDYGKEQQYLLGKYLRTRYAELLDTKFNTKEILVTSSEYDRTIMSAQLALAGLYPNDGGAAAKSSYSYARLGWEAVPVRTVGPKNNHLMLHPSYIFNAEVCPRYFKAFDQAKTSPDFKAAEHRNKELIELVRKNTGVEDDIGWLQLFGGYMMGTVKIEKFYNLSIPTWAEEVLANETNMREFALVFSMLTHTDEMKRLLAGPILGEWVQNMRNKMNGAENRTVFIYSAHDLNLVNVLNTMGLFDPLAGVPAMSSTLFVELYQDEESQSYSVRLFYRDGLTREVSEIKLPGCGEPCTLNTFVDVLQPFIIATNSSTECEIEKEEEEGGRASLSTLDAILIAIICILVLLLAAIEIHHFRQKKTKAYVLETKF